MTDQSDIFEQMHGAWFSDCGRYRYALWRLSARPGRPFRTPLVFCGLNPSTADAVRPDTTVTKMRGFAKRLGYTGGIIVINAFALVSTDPNGLLQGADPVGRLNDVALELLALRRDVVCCWGGTNRSLLPRLGAVERKLGRWAASLWCLGRTKAGHPRHPSRLAYGTPIEPLVRRPSSPGDLELARRVLHR